MEPPVPSVVIANPGHMPWFARSAAALDGMGALSAYIAPFAGVSQRRGMTRLPAAVNRELDRRAPGVRIREELLRSAAAPSEALTVGASRAKLPGFVRRALADHRDRRFDRRVAQSLSPTDSAVLLGYGAALSSIRRARALLIGSALEYAVHHHAFNAAILAEEIRRVPSYAASMQFHDASPRRDARLDQELSEVDRVIALSAFSRSTFVDAGVDPDKVIVNQLGVDGDRFSRSKRVSDGVFRVLFLGVLTQRKGLSYLVDGFARAGIQRSELLLVGQPCNGHAPWRGVAGIEQIDWVSHAETPALLARADVLVLPSLVEGLARVIIEAMAAGIPVIATPNSGAEDVVRDGVDGYIVPIRDADAIAERLRALTDPDRRAAMSAAARVRALEFDWSSYAERSVEILSSIAGVDPP